MPVHNLHIDNQPTATFRADLNDALLALASNASGPDEPAARVAGMLWLDTTTSILKIRDETNSDWLPIALIDSAQNTFTPLINALKAMNASGISVQNMDGDEILKLIAATDQEAIDGVDSLKVITPQSLRAALPLGNPTSVNTYNVATNFALPDSTKAVFIQASGGGGGGAASTGYELERDGVTLPSFAHGHDAASTGVYLRDSTETNVRVLFANGGKGGMATSDQFLSEIPASAFSESNGIGALGGEGATFGATDRPAYRGFNGRFNTEFIIRDDLGELNISIVTGIGGQGGRLKTFDGPREGEKERPHGQDGQRGYAIIWIWS